MTSLFSPDKSSHAAMLASPSAFFASPPAFTPCLQSPLDMQSPFGMPAAQLQSPEAGARPTLRFQPHSTMATGEIGGAFNFAASTQHFNVDIALPQTQNQLRPLQLAHPLLPHHNPDLLDGFLLDGGSPMSPLASFAAQPTVSSGSRKRKSASPSASSADECDDGELVLSASKKSKKHGKSLIDSRNASPTQDAQAGHTSPLLELLQQSNQSAAPTGAKSSKKELRRQKAALKLQRLEAPIARLTEQVSATRAQELQAIELARQMAAQAAHAAQLANQHLAQRDSEMGMVESFFAEEAAASLPPLSPLSASTANGSGSGSDSAPSSALRIAVSSASSSASVSDGDGGDLSECTTPTLRDRRLVANASPVESLDEAIDAALAAAQQQQKHGHSEAPCRAEVEHLVSLQWAEKARHLRTMHHALHSLEEEVMLHSPAPTMDTCWMGSAETALQFVSSGHDDRMEVRAALEEMRAEQSRDLVVTNLDLHESIKEFTSVLLAKSRSQHCTFTVRA